MRLSVELPGPTTLKGGRRQPKNAPALVGARLLKPDAVIPTDDYAAKLSDWQMLGNDRAGDCAAVTWANIRRLTTAYLSTESYPSQDQVWDIYRTQNPDFDPNGSADTNGPGSSADQGMDIQTLLEYLHSVGGPDGVKVVAFARLSTVDEVKQAQAALGSVWLGVNITAANMDEFGNGASWDYVPYSGDDGGHSVPAVADENTNGVDLRVITWAKEQTCTEAFDQNQIEEAWMVIWPEHLGTKAFEAGIDIEGLKADYKALKGTELYAA